MTQAALSEKEIKKAAIEARDKEMDAREKTLNEGKTGVGLRTFLSMTRGKNPQEVKYDGFDTTQTDTLPKSVTQWFEIVKLDPVKDEATVVNYLIEGFNEVAYTSASDPLAEFVEDFWPTEAKAQFRLVVRNYSRGAMVSLEDAVALIKPGFAAQFAAKA